jgi:hypothetical protein
MSVDYRAMVGYGYMVTPAMLDMLYQRGGKDLLEEFQESDWACPADGYYPKDSPYFFGIILEGIAPGMIAPLPTKRNYKHEDLDNMIEEFKKFFPNMEDYICRDWLISGVN